MTKPRKDIIREPKRVLSLGMGVQSTTLAVMSALGEIPEFDIILFSDPGWESPITYKIRDFYFEWLGSRVKSTIQTVGNGNIYEDEVNKHSLYIPARYGSKSIPLRRQCTNEYKIDPINKWLRAYLGHTHPRGGRIPVGVIKMSLGISFDEFYRMKASRLAWIENSYPLVDMKITRQGCVDFLIKNSLPVPPKSACVCCPYSPVSRFLYFKEAFPEEWKKLVEFDNRIRKPTNQMVSRGFTEDLYLTGKGIPVEELKTASTEVEDETCETGYCFV